MTRYPALRYALAAGLITAAVVTVGVLLVRGQVHQQSLIVGAATAFLLQVAAFKLLFAGPVSLQPFIAHVVGMIGRLGVFGVVAFVVLPVTGLTPAPLLFAMVTVFLLTSLIEPRYSPALVRAKPRT